MSRVGLERARPTLYQMPRRIVQSISPTIGVSCSPRPCQLRHREDGEQGPASAPTLLMTWFAMLEGADAAGGHRSRRGRTERCLSEKISILISACGSTAGRGLFSPGCDCRLSACSAHSVQGIGISLETYTTRAVRGSRSGVGIAGLPHVSADLQAPGDRKRTRRPFSDR
jgi:hypothetical protein